MIFKNTVLILCVIGSTLAFTANFIPKSYYVIHPNGERSPTVSLREKRSLENLLLPLIRMRRSGGSGSGSGSGSFSSASSFSSAGAGAGAGSGFGSNDAIFFADNLAAGFEAIAKMAGFPNGIPGTFPPNFPHHIFNSVPGGPPQGGCNNCEETGARPSFRSRFGEGGDGINYSGSAQGAKGVYSASSSSIDSDGNVKYSVKTGKF